LLHYERPSWFSGALSVINSNNRLEMCGGGCWARRGRNAQSGSGKPLSPIPTFSIRSVCQTEKLLFIFFFLSLSPRTFIVIFNDASRRGCHSAHFRFPAVDSPPSKTTPTLLPHNCSTTIPVTTT